MPPLFQTPFSRTSTASEVIAGVDLSGRRAIVTGAGSGIGAEKTDDEHYTAINHLEGDFPGGVVDLRFRFTLRDGRIASLVIEA